MTANDPSESPYFLQDAEAIRLVPDTQRIDHLSLEERDDEDIYRGEQPLPPRSPSISTISSSSSSSSSSASSVFGGRLGAISAVVEHAIATWAKAWASSSSLSTSSSESAPSIVTMTRSQAARRRRRRMSLADIHNQRSEREIAARIRAREEFRYIPRAFDLYVPNLYDAGREEEYETTDSDARQRRFLHTESLPLIVTRLGAALKDRERGRRGRSEAATPESAQTMPILQHHDYMMPDLPTDLAGTSAYQDPHMRRKVRKGKRRAGVAQSTVHHMTPISSMSGEAQHAEKAWWLDVSSPTWEDMRAIGKLLHLHPLTLEDILAQEPREKLELFPKLGYYFIVFRAIESQKTRERLRALRAARAANDSLVDEGIVGDVYVYMVVFREGICSFHFADIGEHADRVRNKMLKLSESVHMTSDWIAHGIMDSIVDSFFPFLEDIEKEVVEIEDLVVTDSVDRQSEIKAAKLEPHRTHTLEQVVAHDSVEDAEKTSSPTLSEKNPHPPKVASSLWRRTQFSVPATWPLHFRRAKRYCRNLYVHFRVVFKHTSTATTTSTVHRMARTRRLVTSLARFLAHKSEVVAQLQKRLMTVGEWGLGHGTDHDQDVFIYMGDVQDHILTLQQSLAHYERVLSHSHPTYLSRLRLSLSKAQSGTDAALVTLSTVSLGVLCIQTLIGLVSMNVHVPQNYYYGHKFDAFAVIISLSIVIIFVYGFFVRMWWVWAKQKRRGKYV